MLKETDYIVLYILSSVVFLIAPFWGMLLSLLIIYKIKLSDRGVTWFSFLIALFWGLLAFTQDSKADINTDAIRYYEMFAAITQNITSMFDLLIIARSEILTFVFVPITALIVKLTHSVQVISLFWVTVSYFMFFISIRRILKYEKLYNQFIYARYLLVMMFCVILFVQMGETIKNAAAFAIAFYSFTLYYTKENIYKVILTLIIAIGIHPSSILFVFLFLYNKIKTNKLIFLGLILFPIAIKIDIFGLIGNFMVGTDGYLAAISEKATSYKGSEGSSLRYLLLSFSTLIVSIYVYLNDRAKLNSNRINVVLLYFIISSFNAANIHSYVRFINYIHPFIFLLLISLKQINKKESNFIRLCYISFFAFFTLRLTLARTLGNGYVSTYMNNSLIDIMFSNIYTYLSYPVFVL